VLSLPQNAVRKQGPNDSQSDCTQEDLD
jgi:hypothetical protein